MVLRAVAVHHIRCLDTIYKRLTISQMACARPFPSFDHCVVTGMHACYMPRDEGGCTDVSMHRSRRRRRIGGESRNFFINRKKLRLTELQQCCAIDYILHTVGSASTLLNSLEAFSSQYAQHASTYLSLVSLTSPHKTNIHFPTRQHFGSLARRLGRVFAHAYFHHREVFEQAEAE